MKTPGRVRQRGSTFTAYWWVKVDGKWKQKSAGGFKTATLAQKGLTSALQDKNDGISRETVDKKLTIAAFLKDHWLPSIRTGSAKGGHKRRESTIAMYETMIDGWIVPRIGKIRLSALTARDVEDLLNSLRTSGSRTGKPLSDRSVQAAYNLLNSALTWGVGRSLMLNNPAAIVGRPGIAARSIVSWTVEEARSFLAAARDDRLFAAWMLLVGRGLRRGELAGLRWADVDLDAGLMQITTTRVMVGTKVVTSTPKTSAGKRSISLSPALVAILKEHRRAQLEDRMAWGEGWVETDHLFVRENGEPISPPSISQRFERLCALTGTRRISLHQLRHTSASLMLADGVPVKVVSEMLGHSDPQVTLAVYAHTIPSMHAAAGARHDDRLLGSGLVRP